MDHVNWKDNDLFKHELILLIVKVEPISGKVLWEQNFEVFFKLK